jgi:multiple sugar transport system substrate-binding protein
MMAGKRIDEVGTMEMRTSALSRRQLLKAGGAAAVVAGVAPSIVIPGRARAQQKTLKILQWKHFVPSYDEWFNGTYVKEWGEKNDTKVMVDNVGLGDITSVVVDEIQAGQGHDLVMLLEPPAVYEDQVIDHREIYEECQSRYGAPPDFAIKSTYNPKTEKYFSFCNAFLPAFLTYRKDLWDAIGTMPDSWDDIRRGGRQIKLLHESPVGISLAPEPNSNHTMRAIMYSYGSSEQDAGGNPALKSKQTLEAIKYVKALYEQAMTAEVLSWNPTSNNSFMVAGTGCLTLDTMSIARASEKLERPFAKDLRLAKAPKGPAGRLAPSFSIVAYFVWNFAKNIEGAKQFLVDYTGHTREGFLASGFQNMPTFPGAARDLAELVGNDANATPPDKYSVLADGAGWTTNVGNPGYTNAAITEIMGRGLIPTMFARAATGQLTPEDALDQADGEVRHIFQKWKDRGKV